MCHGWRCFGDTKNIATAFITMALSCPGQDGPIAPGEDAPTAEELTSPGGATLETLTRCAPQRADELYNEFDFTDPSGTNSDPVILSDGESVPACEAINFQPFVQRAEKLAGFYCDLFQALTGASKAEALKIIRREWYCVTNPSLVTVHIHFQP